MRQICEDPAARRAAIITDTEWLLALGEWPERIATRLGYSHLNALRRALTRWGRRDLASRLNQPRQEKWTP